MGWFIRGGMIRTCNLPAPGRTLLPNWATPHILKKKPWNKPGLEPKLFSLERYYTTIIAFFRGFVKMKKV